MTEHQLVLDLDEWRVTLVDGSVVRVWAHSYGDLEGTTVFQVLMKGTPNYLVAIASLPTDVIATIRSD